MDETDIQRLDESRRRADAAASRRGHAPSGDRSAFQRFDSRGRGRRQGSGHHAARRSARDGAKRRECAGKHNASMLQDVLAKRITEVDFMNGAIVKWGEQVGVRRR